MADVRVVITRELKDRRGSHVAFAGDMGTVDEAELAPDWGPEASVLRDGYKHVRSIPVSALERARSGDEELTRCGRLRARGYLGDEHVLREVAVALRRLHNEFPLTVCAILGVSFDQAHAVFAEWKYEGYFNRHADRADPDAGDRFVRTVKHIRGQSEE